MGEREREGKEVVLAERRPERIGTRASVDLKYIFYCLATLIAAGTPFRPEIKAPCDSSALG